MRVENTGSYLVFNVDAAPGVFPATVHLAGARVRDGHVGANHGEGHPLPHPVVLRIHLGDGEVVDLDLVLLQLEQDLKCESVVVMIQFSIGVDTDN